MQRRVLSRELSALGGQQVSLRGWVHRIRDFGGVRFLVLRDRSGQAQVVVPRTLDLSVITCESVISVSGECSLEPRAPGGVEVVAESIDCISPASPPPLDIFNPNAASKNRLETLLDHRAMSLRIPELTDIVRVEAEVLRAFRTCLRRHEFTEITTPKLVLAGAEGGAAVFEVDYFGQRAYLSQSPQFYKQIMVGSGLERVFEVGHAYRAEKSETSRHLTEYVSLDFEMGFIDSVQDVMKMHADVIRAITETLAENCGEIFARRGISLPSVGEIPQISFPEAKKVLSEKFGKTEGLSGDLDTESERLMCQWALEEFNSELIFVTGYHVDKRPMYAMADLANPPLTESFDLLFRGIEITTGGQRIHDYKQLVESFRRRGLNPDDYEGYLATFKHGMCPHGGMGTGLERLVKQLLMLRNVKEASLFPRDRNRLTP